MMPTVYRRLLARHRSDVTDYSRRDFLARTLSLSTGLLVSGCQWPRRPSIDRRVAIVGAGFAGLACAHELLHLGYDVRVFEARNRVGGRVWSLHDLAERKIVEGGGEYVGGNHPTWWAYARRLELEFSLVETNDEWCPTFMDGRLLSPSEEKQLCDEMTEGFDEMTTEAEAIHADRPWESPDAQRLDRLSTAEWVRGLGATPLGKLAITRMLEAENGVALAQQSYLGNLTQVKGGGLEKFWTETDKYRCRDGNQELARRFARTLGGRLALRRPVIAIQTASRPANVTLADGTVYESDDVVLATPPTVWKHIRIEPPLPPLLPQMGSLVKYLALVKTRFWEADGGAATTFSDGDISLTWEPTKGQGTGNAVLCAYSGGPAAEAVRRYPKERRDASYRAIFELLLRGYGQSFLRSRFMDWPSDQWTLGSYSFPAPGQVTTVGPFLERGHHRLHFAGEHACYKFVGYMEGALQSGIAIAKRLALRDGLWVGG